MDFANISVNKMVGRWSGGRREGIWRITVCVSRLGVSQQNEQCI
jgi:hypothetical protein